jgi:hypothetical protein
VPLFRFVAMAIAKTLSKVFGLATITFFGRMPSRDDDKIALVGVVSLSWLPVLVAIVFPAFAEVIIPFAPDDDTILRAMAIALAIIMPLAVGAAVARMHNQREHGQRSTLTHVLLGFWYSTVVGLTVAAIVVVVPIVKGSYFVRRLTTRRLQLMIPDGDYDGVQDHIEQVLRDEGCDVEISQPNVVLKKLFEVLAFILGDIFARPVSKQMCEMSCTDTDGGWVEITLHPADLTIIGEERAASRFFSVIADAIDVRVVHLTWDEDAQALEDDMRGLFDTLDDGEPVDDDEIDELIVQLRELELDPPEWNAVRRNLYRLQLANATAKATQAHAHAS